MTKTPRLTSILVSIRTGALACRALLPVRRKRHGMRESSQTRRAASVVLAILGSAFLGNCAGYNVKAEWKKYDIADGNFAISLPTAPTTENECNPTFFADPTFRVPPQKVCCDIWQEAVRAGGPCNPEVDADCDGLPNDKDGSLMNSVPYYAPLGANETEDTIYNPIDPKDFNPADFDPRPPGLGWDEVMPNEPCKQCKWVALSGKLTCSPDGRRDHEYKATWRCPTSGVERVVTKRVAARFPCTPPKR